MANIAYDDKQFNKADSIYRKVITISREIGDKEVEILALNGLYTVQIIFRAEQKLYQDKIIQGNTQNLEELRIITQAVELLDQVALPQADFIVLNNAGKTHRDAGNNQLSKKYYE